ncbi:MAG: cupin domain-containing protein [Motiliproteus sp.]
MDNIFADIPEQLPEELITRVLDKPGIRIERIVSQGHRSEPGFWYEQDENEWLVLIQGQARLRFADEQQDRQLIAGDTLLIPAAVRHRVAWTSEQPPCIWICLFYPAEPSG